MNKKKNEGITALHRYWLSANTFRISLSERLKSKDEEMIKRYLTSSGLSDLHIFIYRPFVLMSSWLGALYVVIEGYKDLKLSDPVINKLIASPNVDYLRNFRNGTFHFQPTWFSMKLLPLLKAKNSIPWAIKLHDRFGYFLVEQMDSYLTEKQRVEVEAKMQKFNDELGISHGLRISKPKQAKASLG